MKFIKIAIIVVEFLLGVLYGLFADRDGLTELFLCAIIFAISVLVSLFLVFIFRKNSRWSVFIGANGILGPILFYFTLSLTPDLDRMCSHCYEFQEKGKGDIQYTFHYNTFSKTCEMIKWIPVDEFQRQARWVYGSIVFHKDTMFVNLNGKSNYQGEPNSVTDPFWSIRDSNVYICHDSIFGLPDKNYPLQKAY